MEPKSGTFLEAGASSPADSHPGTADTWLSQGVPKPVLSALGLKLGRIVRRADWGSPPWRSSRLWPWNGQRHSGPWVFHATPHLSAHHSQGLSVSGDAPSSANLCQDPSHWGPVCPDQATAAETGLTQTRFHGTHLCPTCWQVMEKPRGPGISLAKFTACRHDRRRREQLRAGAFNMKISNVFLQLT